MTGFVPAGGFETGPVNHPRSDVDDQPGFLRDRDELLGRDAPVDGMPPRKQRLQAIYLPVHADHRLIQQLEFLVFQRAAQRVFQAQTLQAGGVILGPEDLHVVLAAILGVVHREVRVAQQLCDGLAVTGKNGDADAGGDEQLVVFNLVRRAKGFRNSRDACTAACSSGWRASTMMNSSPPMRPARSSSVSNRFRRWPTSLQQPVTHGMAEDVVDLFEAVEIDE